MTPSDPDLARSQPEDVQPIALVARIAESLPQLDERELNELADAVESLTEAIGLRIDWLYAPADPESPTSPEE
ncbi:hypothetical protein [Microbacterium pumilum]|uniref:Uncharacterized protein n=1 Tax=Microbacterium pumilum TaxID=344165 RepID=A0ABN2SZS2_9MICO